MAEKSAAKRRPNHGKESFETLGRVPLNVPGDWIEARYVGTQVVDSKQGGKEQNVHSFIGTIVTEEKGERYGEFGLWGNMNLDKILLGENADSSVVSKLCGTTLIIECVRREKNKDGTREFSVYKWSEALNQIKLSHEK